MSKNMSKTNFNYPRPFFPRANSHESGAMSTTVIRTITIPVGISEVLIQATAANIRYTLDGTNPSPVSGFRLTAGNDPLLIPVPSSGAALKLIAESAGARLEIEYGE